MQDQKVPKGYKKTEIGIIPEDWEVKRLGEVVDIVGGGTPSTNVSKYWDGNINWFTPSEIGKYKYVKHSQRKITEEGLKNSSAKLLPVGTILLTSRATIGEVAILKKISTTNQGFQSLIVKDSNEREFIYYLLKKIKKILIERANGSTFLEISPKEISQILIPLPPLPEQRAIAKVLSDIDQLIETLDKLIEKKKLIKKGTMQLLLTGKKRLPGFTGKWVRKKLGEIGEITMGQSPDSKFYNDKGIGIPLIQGNSDIKNKRTIKRIFTVHKPKISKKGDIILTVRAPVGEVAINTGDACIGRGVCSISSQNNLFLFFLLDFHRDEWKNYSEGSTYDSVNSNIVKNFSLKLPPTIEEQRAIAQILSDMDAEIEALEKQKLKYENIKKGAMDLLLTGKVRLK